ncbi:hypothetical protein [Clostridioides difficile]|uniref:hypothetical protein n=1 Tax=Clostridioides difficile TaxID=1496 RepID=UPI000C9C105D|nr:hypothetical protein [Clostridioides difficile]HBG7286097.1 hypothetical protein [Clostridioides difficile]
MDEERIVILEKDCSREKFNIIKWILNDINKSDLEIINDIHDIHNIKYKNTIKSYINNIKNKCS